MAGELDVNAIIGFAHFLAVQVQVFGRYDRAVASYRLYAALAEHMGCDFGIGGVVTVLVHGPYTDGIHVIKEENKYIPVAEVIYQFAAEIVRYVSHVSVMSVIFGLECIEVAVFEYLVI